MQVQGQRERQVGAQISRGTTILKHATARVQLHAYRMVTVSAPGHGLEPDWLAMFGPEQCGAVGLTKM